MSEKNKKSQLFRTVDMLSIVLMVGFVSVVFAVILSETFRDTKPREALAMAEALAQEIHSRHLYKDTSDNSQRGPASIGTSPVFSSGQVGKDPWGHPYQYLVRRSEAEPNSYLVMVWSIGPNGIAETVPEEIDLQSKSKTFATKGDDLGHFERLTVDL